MILVTLGAVFTSIVADIGGLDGIKKRGVFQAGLAQPVRKKGPPIFGY